MIQGTKHATIERVAAINLHGQIYFDIFYHTADDPAGKTQAARVGDDAIYANPQTGDQITVHYLMNMVMRIERRDTREP